MNERSVFLAALEIDCGQRATYLDAACGTNESFGTEAPTGCRAIEVGASRIQGQTVGYAFRIFYKMLDGWKETARAFNEVSATFSGADPKRLLVAYQVPLAPRAMS